MYFGVNSRARFRYFLLRSARRQEPYLEIGLSRLPPDASSRNQLALSPSLLVFVFALRR